jgi:hypothetical protein
VATIAVILMAVAQMNAWPHLNLKRLYAKAGFNYASDTRSFRLHHHHHRGNLGEFVREELGELCVLAFAGLMLIEVAFSGRDCRAGDSLCMFSHATSETKDHPVTWLRPYPA